MEESRTEKAFKNIKSGAMLPIVSKIMTFIVRTVFIKVLSTEYLGINGLFTNILAFLAFTELGIGGSIVYHLYKPVAQNDVPKVKSLMKFYKKSYNIIAITILLMGLSIIPFMDIIIKEPPSIKENLIVIYILFLINTVSSYLFTYKRSIIFVNQKNNVANNIDCIASVVINLLEILVLLLTRNYMLYLVTIVVGGIINNLIVSVKANKMFPYLKEKNVKKLEKKEKKGIFNAVKAMIIYQFGNVFLNSTDNIIISAMVNLTMVGLCSNYVVVIDSINVILKSALGGIDASVGNVNAIENKEKKEDIFYEMFSTHFLIYSFVTIAFFVLLNPFVSLWAGRNYVVDISIPVALALNFYINGMNKTTSNYRMTLGLFQKAKITPIIAIVVNIVLSIVLCKIMGVVGIFIATGISRLVSFTWIDPYLIYKHEFKKSVLVYFKKYITYLILLLVEAAICVLLVSFIKQDNIYSFIVKGIIVCIIPNCINCIVFRKSKEMINLKKRIGIIFKKKKLPA